MNNRIRTLVTVLTAFALAFGTMALTGCGGQQNEQDNCYGEDMPVINK